MRFILILLLAEIAFGMDMIFGRILGRIREIFQDVPRGVEYDDFIWPGEPERTVGTLEQVLAFNEAQRERRNRASNLRMVNEEQAEPKSGTDALGAEDLEYEEDDS